MRVGYLLIAMGIISFFIVGFMYGIFYDMHAQLYVLGQDMGTHKQAWSFVYTALLLGGFWLSFVAAFIIGWITSVLREGGD